MMSMPSGSPLQTESEGQVQQARSRLLTLRHWEIVNTQTAKTMVTCDSMIDSSHKDRVVCGVGGWAFLV